MKFAFAFAALAASTLLAVAPARAADDGPSYENGPVWTYLQIQTKEGHFDEYMHWLSTSWKTQEEGLKRAGAILDYKVLVIDSPRAGEPDIMLAQQYRSLAAMDVPIADQYAMQAKVAGPLSRANAAQAERGAIRTNMGTITMHEAILK